MKIAQWLIGIASAALVPGAGAEPSNVSPSGFDITVKRELQATPLQALPAIGRIGQWWSPAHSWSGSASNMTLELAAGGCFCERWGDGSAVEHGRVIALRRDAKEVAVRLHANLGPFLEMPVQGVLGFTVTAKDGGSALTVTYRLRGAADASLDKLAAPVDRVIAQQAERLARFIDTGKPE